MNISWGADSKNRPVLVFIVNESEVAAYRITSQYESKSNAIRAQYFAINEWARAGLHKQSYVDTGTLITLSADAFLGKMPIGKLTQNDKIRLLNFLSE
jgi:hypothetical protein